MLVYLVRHAIAEDRSESNGHDDSSRRLTDRGIRRMRRNIESLRSLGAAFDAIWTSPLVRARETAELLATLTVDGGRVHVVEDLAPGGDLDALLDRIAMADCPNGLALVGHEPDLGELGSLMLHGRNDGALAFKKGGVACFETQNGSRPLRGILQWMLTPRQMRAMA